MPRKPKSVTVMDRYVVRDIEAAESFLGEGAFSMVWRGFDKITNEEVAVKTYKVDPKDRKGKVVALTKFKRQIEVLLDLQQPIEPSKIADPALWNEALKEVDVATCFLQLKDYSKDSDGNPGMHKDGGFYVITELAQYSLQDYLQDRREARDELSLDDIRALSKRLFMIGAVLHTKGLVHLDLKPENVMMISNHWKIIDVDGCVAIGSDICIDDATISFSPAYCSPEFAAFPIGEYDYLKIYPSMDVWSMALCIVECVLLDVLVGPTYASQLGANCPLDSGFAILEWLSESKPIKLPKKLTTLHPEFKALLDSLMTKNVRERLSLAQALDHQFVKTLNINTTAVSSSVSTFSRTANARAVRHRAKAAEKDAPVFKDVLWKLNQDGDVTDTNAFLARDMWLAQGGCLCYFSRKENRALVLIDAADLRNSTVTLISEGAAALPHTFELHLPAGEDGMERRPEVFAAETAEARSRWVEEFERCKKGDARRTANFRDVREFRLKVRNRRKAIEDEQTKQSDAFEPLFKTRLFKLNQDGDLENPDHFLPRDMWLAKNGALCYFSKKEGRPLMYHSADDISGGQVKALASTVKVAMPFVFSLQLAPKDGLEYDAGYFAAESEEIRDQWISRLRDLAK